MCLPKRHSSILQTKCGKRVNRRQIARHVRRARHMWVCGPWCGRKHLNKWYTVEAIGNEHKKRTQSDQSGPETKSHGHFATCRMLNAFRAWKCRTSWFYWSHISFVFVTKEKRNRLKFSCEYDLVTHNKFKRFLSLPPSHPHRTHPSLLNFLSGKHVRGFCFLLFPFFHVENWGSGTFVWIKLTCIK